MARKYASVQVNDRGLMRKMSLLRNEMWVAQTKTAKTLAKIGVNYAAARAPYDRGPGGGGTARAIYAKPQEQSRSRTKWLILAPDVHKTSIPGGLVQYIHSDRPGAQTHFREDRDRKFMYSTRKYLNDIKTKVADGNFNRIKIR